MLTVDEIRNIRHCISSRSSEDDKAPAKTFFTFKGIKYSYDRYHSNGKNGLTSYNYLKGDFEIVLSDLLNKEGIVVPAAPSVDRSVEINKLKDQVFQTLKLEEYSNQIFKFRLAILSLYARRLGVDLDDQNVADGAKACAIEAIDSMTRYITQYHRLTGSSSSWGMRDVIDVDGELIKEPEFAQYHEFSDLPGGLIEKYFRGLHRKYVLNAQANLPGQAALQRVASQTHPDLLKK